MKLSSDALRAKAVEVRKDIVKSLYHSQSGHPGGSLSGTDIATALYFNVMNIDPENPKMEGRDKFVLSKGHAAPLLYAVLAERGYFDKEELWGLRKIDSRLQGHPDMKNIPGVEMSTGSLGQGISAAVGIALAGKLDNAPGRVYALLGDGEIQEGIVWEAAMAAAHYKLDNLTAIVDWNGIQIDGRNEEVMTITPIKEKFESFGWAAFDADGHDVKSIDEALQKAKAVKGQPAVIVAKTIKGKGVSFMEDTNAWHGKAPNNDELKQALEELGGEL